MKNNRLDDPSPSSSPTCVGRDLNPRTPAGPAPEAGAFDLAWQPTPMTRKSGREIQRDLSSKTLNPTPLTGLGNPRAHNVLPLKA